MKTILWMGWKDIRLLARDRMGFFFVFVFPLIYASFFGSLFSGGGHGGTEAGLPIAIVDQCGTEASKRFVAQLDEAPEFDITPEEYDRALASVRKGSQVAYIILEPEFDNARLNVFSGQSTGVRIAVDPSRRAEGYMLRGVLTKHLFQHAMTSMQEPGQVESWIADSLAELAKSDDMDAEEKKSIIQFLSELRKFMKEGAGESFGQMPALSGDAMITVDELEPAKRTGPPNAFNFSFPQGIIWAILSCTSAFGISLVQERTRGTLHRLEIAPISRVHILAGKAVACAFAIIVVATFDYIFAALVFNVIPGNPLYLAFAILSAAIGFTGLMMLLATFGRSEVATSGIAWAVLLVMAMTGGGMIPYFIMPSWMRTLSHISPVKWAIVGMEGGVWRDYSLAEMMVPCGILIIFGMICFGIGATLFARSK